MSDGTLRLGVRSAQNAESPWCVFDNFVLTYYGTDLVLEDGKAMPEIKADMEVASVSYDRSVEADRMISFILPVSVPAENLNGTAYELSSVKGDVLIFTAVTGSTAANKPYILVPSADGKMLKDMTETLLPATPASLSVTMSGVEFFGTYTTQTVSGVYGLSDGKFVGVNTGTLSPYRAAISVDSGVKAYVISLDDNATGISSLEFSIDDKNYRVYNLSGQLLQKIQKGINIINGKKIIK